MVKCPECGEDNPNNAHFCKNCGENLEQTYETQVIEEPEEIYKYCQHCGYGIKSEASKICSKCGERVDTNDTTYCQYCGKVIDRRAEICPFCGVRVKPNNEKNPTLALILSFLISGLGQIYNGNVLKGIILLILVYFLILTIIGAIFGVILWVYGMYDAYTTAKRINEEEF